MHKTASTPLLNNSRRPSKLGYALVKQRIDEARKLTSEQRLLMALELSGLAAALQRACSKKP